jgi:hypothetical protein
MKAYISLRNNWQTLVVDYELGPAVERAASVAVGWYRNSFRPQPIGMPGTPKDVVIGDGQTGGATIQVGPAAYWSLPSGSPDIAVPDEMKTTPVAPRTLEHGKDFLVFYGAARASGLVATRTDNTLVVGTGHGLRDGELVTVVSAGTLPAGLAADRLYYVVGRTATAVSLALTPGGSAVTLSNAGTGVHQVIPFAKVAQFDMADGPNYSNDVPLR